MVIEPETQWREVLHPSRLVQSHSIAWANTGKSLTRSDGRTGRRTKRMWVDHGSVGANEWLERDLACWVHMPLGIAVVVLTPQTSGRGALRLHRVLNES